MRTTFCEATPEDLDRIIAARRVLIEINGEVLTQRARLDPADLSCLLAFHDETHGIATVGAK